MKNIVIDNVLDAIHYILERNGFSFTSRQIERADDYIIPFIDSLDISDKEFRVKVSGAPRFVNDKRLFPLLVRYFAFIEDNTTLYNELMEEGFLFTVGERIKFYALDRSLSSHFKKNEYKRLLIKNEDAISSFYYSIRGIDRDEKESVCREFSEIIHIDHSTLTVGDNIDYMNNHNFLIKRNIEFFGKDFLLRLNKSQREILNSFHFAFDEEIVSKIKELFTKYPDYVNIFPLNGSLFHLFSVDEINSMSVKDYNLYDAAIRNNLFNRMRNILQLNPEFDCPISFIREEIFRVLDDSEIIDLSDEAIKKISEIRIPEVDGVLVMPIGKINRIILLDKTSRKIKGFAK